MPTASPPDGAIERSSLVCRFFCNSDDIPAQSLEQLALAAIEQAGRTDEMIVVGGAGMKEMVDRIRNGDETVPVNVTYPPAMISTAIEMTAVGVTGAAPMSGEFIIASELITPENADDFYFEDSPY